jgi:[acyl-carrier-protein] S-malonyltransferase
MKTAIIFPGQGAQSAGMGKDLYEQNSAYKATFDLLDSGVSISLKNACFDGCEKSAYVQPAIFAHSISLFKAMDMTADIYAGLSLGEYSALSAGGVIDAIDGIGLVNKRGGIMDGAVTAGTCGMVSAIGLDIKACEKIADAIDELWVANHISEAQIVFAGSNEAVKTATQKIEALGAKAFALNTAGPFHSPMLDCAASEFKQLFEKVNLGEKSAMIYSNFTGLPYDGDANYSQLLASQMSGRVRWFEVCENMIDSGVDRIIEVGPGMVLSKVLKRAVKTKGLDIDISSVRDLKSLNKFLDK